MYKEHLIERIPEAFQNHQEVIDYLAVAGELFDEYVETIHGMDEYRSWTQKDRNRLRQLALDFGMNFPRNIDENIQRTIVRDIHSIYSRVGIKQFSDWIFRIIGWEIDIQHAWLPNPDQYDPSIKDIHQLNDYGGNSDVTITNFFEADYRAFYIGDSFVADDGNVYFRGRRFFDDEITIDQLEIVGEDYDELTKYRTRDKVGATPYIFVNVTEEDYTNYLNPYVDEESGQIYSFDRAEQFTVIENILNYYVFDEFRPTHVRVVIIVKTESNEDDVIIYDDMSLEYESKPLEMEDDTVITDEETSRLDHIIRAGSLFMSGTPPSPFGRKMVIAPLDTRQWKDNSDSVRYSHGNGKRFRIEGVKDFQPVPLSRTKEFSFYTPDKEEFKFRRVYSDDDDFFSAHIEAGSAESVYSFPFDDEDESISLCFDVRSDSYGIIDGKEPPSIIIREPTDVTSPNFTPSSVNGDTYLIGSTSDEGETFNDDFLVKTDFQSDTQEESLDSEVTFLYDYNIDVMAKSNNRDSSYSLLIENPTEGDLEGLTEWNTLLFVPNIRLGFDFVIDVKYLPQPMWESDPRNR